MLLWWGLFDRDLYVEHGDKRFGPYNPVGGPIPLHRYRARQKTRGEERADRIAALADGAARRPSKRPSAFRPAGRIAAR